MHNLLEVMEYTGLMTSQLCCKGDVQCSCSVAVKRIYFICARVTAIEEVSNLYQATILGSLSLGATGSLPGAGILKILKFHRYLLSNKGIETITKMLPLSKTVVQRRV